MPLPQAAAALLLALRASAQHTTPLPSTTAPNIVVILADDLGIDALKLYEVILGAGWVAAGCGFSPAIPCSPTLELPNIERLREQGVLFTQAWANPTCSPTRATILTGRYGFRYGIGASIQPCGRASGTSLPDTEVLLPEALGSGFECGAFGKWHLAATPDAQVDCTSPGAPWSNGFHAFRGQFQPVSAPYCDPAGGIPPWKKIVAWGDGSTCTSLETDVAPTTCCLLKEQVQDALDWIVEEHAKGQRFFCYLAPQSPFELPFWPEASATCVTVPAGSACTIATSGEKPLAYGARIEALDQEIGRVLDTLEALAGPGQHWWQTTTVVFLGDNGTPRSVARAPFGTAKAKSSLYEGGLRVPFFIAGADVAPARRGRISHELVDTVDVFTTVVSLANVAAPRGVRLDGIDLSPYLKTNPLRGLRAYSYAETWPNVATNTSSTCFQGLGASQPDRVLRARIGGELWKLWYSNDGVLSNDVLYDLSADPCENVPLSPLRNPWQYTRLVYHLQRVTGSCP
jgi:arylsulfatase A-like enzyme